MNNRTLSAKNPKDVNLWKQQLGTVPDELWDNLGMETLILADNALTTISPKIARLKNLRTLDLGHNKLSSLPESIGEVNGLRDFLYLHDNALHSLPSSFKKLS